MQTAPGMAGSQARPTHRETPSGRASAPVIRPPRPSVSEARYVLGEEIARGGMGRVVEATDRLLGRTVAVKEALIPEGELRDRFMRETRITARLEHPSVVPIYDAGTTTYGISELATKATSRYVVAGSDGVVLVWNLDHVLPRHLPIGTREVAGYVGPEQLVVAHDDRTLSWVDLRTETRMTLPLRGRTVDVAFAPDGARIVVSEDDGKATLYTRGDASGVLIWNQVLPSSAAEVSALIDELTNAHVSPGAGITGTGSLRWAW